ncbi:MAG: DUF1284 domain-containing protein [Candidatus Methanoperedens sp.]|nr:DUF1284 domain-containing protein [Candidatus Methanoperedens sp.]
MGGLAKGSISLRIFIRMSTIPILRDEILRFKNDRESRSKLRGHHLICLNFFRGEGYSEDFIRNIYEVLTKEKVEIVSGPDEVCAKCPYLKDEKCKSFEYTNEMILIQDKKALGLLGFMPGMIVDWNMIAARLSDILEEWKAQFCAGCGYREVCFNE